jgi:hypothetical protein
MDYADWLALGGSSAIRGGAFARPVNPRLLGQLLANKAAKPATLKSKTYRQECRRLIVRVHRLAGLVDDLLSPMAQRRRARAATHSPSIMEQSAPGAAGAAARMRHSAVVQRWRKGF